MVESKRVGSGGIGEAHLGKLQTSVERIILTAMHVHLYASAQHMPHKTLLPDYAEHPRT